MKTSSKIENTLENKAKFFAQYWGQNVFIGINSDLKSRKLYSVNHHTIINTENSFLKLKSLSDITDEDLLEVCKLLNYKQTEGGLTFSKRWIYGLSINNFNGFVGESKIHYHSLRTTDFIRSKGYALPFMGLSVEELIQYGWVKLKTNQPNI